MRRPDDGRAEFGWQPTVSGRALSVERRDQPIRSRISIDLDNRQLREPRIRDAVQVIIAELADIKREQAAEAAAERADRPTPSQPRD